MNFGHSGAGVVLCGGGAVYAPCESLPCSFNWYGIAGGGHSPVDAQGHPLGMTEVVWTPSTCDHGCSPVQIELYVNSPDINGDLLVNLSDLPLFSADLSSYNFRSDFNFDGVVNLNDLAIFTSGFGAVCGAN